MSTLKVGSSFYKMFMVMLFLVSISQTTGYCADDRELAYVELTGNEEDFWGEFYWPWGSAVFGDPDTSFMTWEEFKEGDVTYHEGFLFFIARNDREQLDEEGVKDSVQFDLTYDLLENRVYGTLTGYAVTTMDYDKYQFHEGSWVHYAYPQTFGRGLVNAVCEAWVEIPIDFELTPDGYLMEFEEVIDVDVTFHALVKRYGYPPEKMVDKFEERTTTVSIQITITGYVYQSGENIQVSFRVWTFNQTGKLGQPQFSYSLECGNPCTAITGVEWKESPSEPDTPTSEEEEPISETNITEPATESPVIVPDSSSTQSLNLSGILLQGAVSAGAGFGFGEMLKRFFGKTSMEQLTPKDLELLKEKLNKASTGASESEDIIKLKKEDVGTRQARRKKRLEKLRKLFGVPSVDGYLLWGLPWVEKGWSIQNEINDKYETMRKSKGITREQEYKEIVKNKPKFLEEVLQKYVYEKTLGKTDLDVTTYLERNTSGEQMKEINQWNEHMHSKHSRDKERAMESFSSSFSATAGARG